MNPPDAWDRLLTSLYDASLDSALWPVVSEMIDEALDVKGNALLIASGPEYEARFFLGVCLYRGQRRVDLEREYLETYYRLDDRLQRLRRLPAGKLLHLTEIYTKQELKTSPAYNDFGARSDGTNSLNVRLCGADGSDFAWVILDPVRADWQDAQTRTIERLLPHVRHCVRVHQAVASANALAGPVFPLLDNARLGVIQLDRRGRIAQLNDSAYRLLRQGNGLGEKHGFLHAWMPGEDTQLKALVAAALPAPSGQAVGGSLCVSRPPKVPGLTLHVHPATVRQTDFGVPNLGALVLIEGLERPLRIDADLVGSVFGLTAAESRVAVLLAEGQTVPDIAALSGRAQSTVRSHLRHIHVKLGVSRRADLVRLVLSVPERGVPAPPLKPMRRVHRHRSAYR